jgi:cytochrome c biogenesis protein CcdA
MAVSNAELNAAEAAYHKILWTILGHTIFFVVCCVAAIILRRFLRMPPALLSVAFFVALLLFGGDLLRFIRCRSRLRQLREQQNLS